MKNTMVVTFRRRGHSRQVWIGRFECGSLEANRLEALREAWNTNSEILSVA